MTRDERLNHLERAVAQMQRVFSHVAQQLAEQNLRIRFVMQWFRFQQQSPKGLVDLQGRPVTEAAKLSLYQIYQAGGRDQMIASLEAEMAAMTTQLTATEHQDLDAFEQDVTDASPSNDRQDDASIDRSASNGESGQNGPAPPTPGAAPERRPGHPGHAKPPVH